MTPRDYQLEALAGIRAAFRRHNRALLVLPTGTGKTIVFAYLAKEWDAGRVMVVAPRIELTGQAAKKLKRVTGVQPSIEQGDLYSNESWWARNRFVVASKQTLMGRGERHKRFEGIGLLIIDEGHEFLTQPSKQMIDYYVDLGAKVLVVTATPRVGRRSMRNLVDTCAYELSIARAIEGGWLVGPKAHCVRVDSLDLSKVHTSSKGDFIKSELAEVMADDKVVIEIAAITAAESFADGRPLKTVVYCAGVSEARRVAVRLQSAHGINARMICADQQQCDLRERHEIVRSFAEDPDGVQVVANVGCLTTGWDCPNLEHIVMARPTKSLTLFQQILGRGTRPLDGVVDFEGSTPESRKAAIAASAKPHFKVTDLRDNSLEHRLVTTVDALAGKMGLPHANYARERLEKADTPANVMELLEEARRELAAREAARLADVEARAHYSRQDVDLMEARREGRVRSNGERVARFMWGRYKGEAVREVPTGYLYSQQKNEKLPGWLRQSIQREIDRRQHSNGFAKLDDVNRLFAEASVGGPIEKPAPLPAWL